MKVLLFSVIASLGAVEPMLIELIVPGVSYHTDRSYNYNTLNYGLGLGIVQPQKNEQYEIGAYVVTYKDSFQETAYLGVASVKYWSSIDIHKFGVSGQAGFINGSGYKGIALFPLLNYQFNDEHGLSFLYVPNIGPNRRYPEDNPKHNATSVFVLFYSYRFK